MQIRVLGPVDVLGARGAVNVGGGRQRRLLAALAAHPNTVVSTERLVEIVWEDDPPETARRVFRTYVNRLRRALEEAEDGLDANAVIVTQSPGYALMIHGEQLDVLSAERLIAEARRRRSVEPDASARLLGEALALWRGPAFGEFAHEEWAAPGAARLGELAVVAAEEWCEVRLDLDDPAEVVPDLRLWIADHPWREGLRELEMVALSRAGRQAEALRAFQAYRGTLAEAGLEPGPRLVSLERQIATGDPDLEAAGAGRRVRDYRLIAKIGAGSFGEVYRGNQPSLDRMVAVKVIRPELADDPEFVRRFEAEAQLVAQLEHPRIVPLYDFWREPGAAYLVMRWLRGGTVAEALQTGPLSGNAVSRLVDHVGDALRAAHRAGVVHGDVKPANVLVDDDGGYYLSDFGLAHLADNVRSPLDPSADIAGLASTVHAALGGDARDFSDDVAGLLQNPDRFQSVDEFLAAYQGAVSEVGWPSGPGPGADLVNPYVGLRPFGEAEASRFFGREGLVARLLGRIAESRWLTVVGPSGSGKSSVVRAGVLPALRSGQMPGSDQWFLTTMIPGPKPFEELETALLRVAVNPPETLLSQLTEDDRGIARAVSRILPDRTGELTLVLDQFEELFTLVEPDERERFLAGLASAVTDERSQLRVITTLRADFYDRPLRSRAIADLVRTGTEVITPMTAAEIEAAIVRPAHACGAAFEGALAGRIAADVSNQSGSLPLLQYALSELFERNRSGLLTVAAYDELGGVRGALTSQADATLAALGPAGREAARRLFSRLVTLGEGVEDTRRRARLTELPSDEAAHDALDAFAAARLLTHDRDPASRAPTVEVAHEALIREWPTLQGWLDDDRDGLRLLRHLGDSASAWDAGGREQSELYRGGRLAAARDWAEAHSDQLTGFEADFVEASRAAAEAERQTEERRVRRLRRLVGAVGAALVVALVAGGLAFQAQQRADDDARRAEESAAEAIAQGELADEQRQRAEDAAELATVSSEEAAAQRQVAEGRSLLAAVPNAIAQDPQLALLLSMAAADLLGADPRVTSALHDTLAAQRTLYQTEWTGDLVNGFEVEGDLSADGRLLAVVGPFGNRVEVHSVDDRRLLWSHAFDVERPLEHKVMAQFVGDGDELLLGLSWHPEVDRALEPPSPELGFHVLDSLTGQELRRYDSGPCGPVGKRLTRWGAIGEAGWSSTVTLGISQRWFDEFGCSSADPAAGRSVPYPEIDVMRVDLVTGELVPIVAGWGVDTLTVAMSGDGRRAALGLAASAPGTFTVIDIETGEVVNVVANATDWPGLLLNHDGSVAAAQGPTENDVRWIDVGTGALLRAYTFSQADVRLSGAWLSADGTRFLISDQGGTLSMFESASGEEVLAIPSDGPIGVVRATPDLSRVATFGSEFGRAVTVSTLDERSSVPEVTSFDPCGDAGLERKFFLNGGLLSHEELLTVMAFCDPLDNANQQLPVVTFDGEARTPARAYTYSLSNRELLATHQTFGQTLAATDDSLAAMQKWAQNGDDGWRGGEVVMVDLRTGEPLEALRGVCTLDLEQYRFVEGPLGCDGPGVAIENADVAISSDGSIVALSSSTQPGVGRAWNRATGAAVDLEGPIGALGISPDGSMLAVVEQFDPSLGGLGRLRMFTTDDFELVAEGPVLSERVRGGLAFSPDGNRVVVIAGDPGATIRFHDAGTLAVTKRLAEPHEVAVSEFAFSASGSLLATVGADGFARVWDPQTETVIQEIDVGGFPTAVTFVANGRELAVATREGGVKVYYLEIQDLLDEAQRRVRRGFTDAECGRYFLDRVCPTLDDRTPSS